MKTKGQNERPADEPNVEQYQLADDGLIPNNPKLPLLIYRGAIELGPDPAATFEHLFAGNGWTGGWRNGIYPYHHYHSTAHEVLGIFSGWAAVRFGGEQGVTATVQAGDVVVIPAGVAHKKLESRGDLGVVGAYPQGQDWDLCRGNASDRPQADENIRRVSLPSHDPVFGSGGPLMRYWKGAGEDR